ncbi:MAG: FtsQ-type POTRA domain-containing protein [SAR324 cluster bacterium]|nr:FtsQ-type POTRA domain-containing protein [SAR324 cluster bacterium]MBL7035768.1 FtsQ-type POTRA domain-containing protein [SAR324 cluster bacterium]
MQDLKRQSSRRPAVRKLRTTSVSIRKNRSNPIPGIALKLRKPSTDPNNRTSWIPQYFKENEPALLRHKIRWLLEKLIAFCGLVFILWLTGGSIQVGQAYFQKALTKVQINGNQLLSDAEVLRTSGLRPGQRLIDLNPYQLAARLQVHPLVQKADIRRRFPDEIFLFFNEYQPVALLKITQQANVFSPTAITKQNYVLIGKDQRLLKQLSVAELLDSTHKRLPLIKGLTVSEMKLGTRLDSAVLARGIKFLTTFQEMAATQNAEISVTHIESEDQADLVNWPAMPIHIDISDPLNLKLNWPQNYSNLQPSSSQPLRSVPLTIQMGKRDFDKRLKTFQTIYPALYKQHPQLKSIDLRYRNRVMLVP